MTICCIVALSIQLRFGIISEMLQSAFNLPFSKKSRRTIITMSILHIKLCDTITTFNQTFSFPMAMLLGVNMMASSFGLFELYDAIMEDRVDALQIGFCLGMTFINFHYFVLNLVLIFCCDRTIKKGKSIELVLHNTVYEKGNNSKRIRLFMQQISHYMPDISCGLFNFNWKIIHSVNN